MVANAIGAKPPADLIIGGCTDDTRGRFAQNTAGTAMLALGVPALLACYSFS